MLPLRGATWLLPAGYYVFVKKKKMERVEM